MAVAEKTKPQAVAPQEAQPKGAVAVFQPPRLPYHPSIEERFGIDRSSWKALVEAVFPLASSVDSVVLALSYCKARRLDPFKKPVHIVPIYSKEKGKMVDTIWPGIAEHRTTAFRTGQYAGADPANFGPMIERQFTGETKQGIQKVDVRFPEWCQITVHRLIDGLRVPMPGPRVYWLETYARMGRTDLPNDMWQKRPSGQLEKCAEAAALRKAFPEEIGDELTADEAGSVTIGEMRDVTPTKPTREDFREPPKAEGAKPEAEEQLPDAEGFTLLSNEGEILWVGADSQEFVRRLNLEMEAVAKQPGMIDGLWETHEEQIKRCSPVVAKVASDKRAALTGKLV